MDYIYLVKIIAVAAVGLFFINLLSKYVSRMVVAFVLLPFMVTIQVLILHNAIVLDGTDLEKLKSKEQVVKAEDFTSASLAKASTNQAKIMNYCLELEYKTLTGGLPDKEQNKCSIENTKIIFSNLTESVSSGIKKQKIPDEFKETSANEYAVFSKTFDNFLDAAANRLLGVKNSTEEKAYSEYLNRGFAPLRPAIERVAVLKLTKELDLLKAEDSAAKAKLDNMSRLYAKNCVAFSKENCRIVADKLNSKIQGA